MLNSPSAYCRSHPLVLEPGLAVGIGSRSIIDNARAKHFDLFSPCISENEPQANVLEPFLAFLGTVVGVRHNT